jgi:hypothetical protein
MKHEKVSQDFPSKYLTWEDIDGLTEEQRTVTISRAEWEEVELADDKTGKAKKEPRRVVYFEKAQKGLVLCKTNAYSIGYLHNELTYGNWVGKQITLIVREVMSFGEKVNAVRIKMDPETYARVAKKVKGRGKHQPWLGGPA